MKSVFKHRDHEALIRSLIKRYRITRIDKRSCKLVSKRTNLTWKIEILPSTSMEA